MLAHWLGAAIHAVGAIGSLDGIGSLGAGRASWFGSM